MRPLFLLALTAASLLTGSCAMCGQCAEAIRINVTVTDESGPPSISDSRIQCADGGAGHWYCTAYELPEGTHTVAVSAPGHDAQFLTIELGPPMGGDLFCGPCPDGFFATVTF